MLIQKSNPKSAFPNEVLLASMEQLLLHPLSYKYTYTSPKYLFFKRVISLVREDDDDHTTNCRKINPGMVQEE